MEFTCLSLRAIPDLLIPFDTFWKVIVRHAVEEDHPPDEALLYQTWLSRFITLSHFCREFDSQLCNSEEVRVTVKSNATMKAVKEAGNQACWSFLQTFCLELSWIWDDFGNLNIPSWLLQQALIKHLGKPELLQTCRLVQRVGENGAFSGFKVGLRAASS